MDKFELKKRLKEDFGFDDFRKGQEEALISISQGNSCLVLMPTGNGKSLLYQFFSKNRKNENANDLVLVISPLIALMQDQVQRAQDLGIKATFINSSLDKDERHRRYDLLSKNSYDLLFVTPERFRKDDFREALLKNKIKLFAIDEAHCISHWGHDFRPDYSRLAEFRQLLGNPLTVAMTATATPAVQKDILRQLKIEQSPVLHSGILRENLKISVIDVYGLENKVKKFLEILKAKENEEEKRSCIVYFSLIGTLAKFSELLTKNKVEHFVYHGDLNPKERFKNQKQFIEQKGGVILATPAFGLGIDKSDIGTVVHCELPGSLESYFQEIGRAGRDGVISDCVLLYDEDDVSIQMEFIKWSFPDEEFIHKIWDLLNHHKDKVLQGGKDWLREQMVFKNKKDFRVEAALNILQRWGCLEVLESNPNSVRGGEGFAYITLDKLDSKHFKTENSKEQIKNKNMKLLDMVRWVQNDSECRLKIIYEYFGHQEEPCGHCDNCLK